MRAHSPGLQNFLFCFSALGAMTLKVFNASKKIGKCKVAHFAHALKGARTKLKICAARSFFFALPHSSWHSSFTVPFQPRWSLLLSEESPRFVSPPLLINSWTFFSSDLFLISNLICSENFSGPDWPQNSWKIRNSNKSEVSFRKNSGFFC